MSQQQQHQQHQGTSSSKRPDPEEGTSSPKQGHPQQLGTRRSPLINLEAQEAASLPAKREHHRYDGNVSYKDQVRDALSSSSLLATTTRAAGAGDVPLVNAVAVSESRIAAEEHEDRLHDAELRAALAAASVRNQEARLAQIERKLAAVPLPTPPQQQLPQQTRNIFSRHADEGDVDATDALDDADDDDEEIGKQQQQQQQVDNTVKATKNVEDTANESNNQSGVCSPKHLSQLQLCYIMGVAAAVVIVAVTVAGICGTGQCSSPNDPTPTARAVSILYYINNITLSSRTLVYPSSSSAEERAVRWLIDDDRDTTMDDEQALRQRYVLATLWFLQETTGFGTGNEYARTWTTRLDECEWFEVRCNDRGLVTALLLGEENVKGHIPNDLGLLTGLTSLSLWGNGLSGAIPPSLGALTALTRLDLEDNILSGTIPSSLGALTALELLYLSDNFLSGTVPFCDSGIQAFTDLVADCAAVSCTCCTGCCPAAFENISVSTWCEK
jgi:hypothetical protein